jgi:hypothetical protein
VGPIGSYNPYAPQILGQEWAPIRDENVSFPEDQNIAEYGHGFTLTSAKVLQDGRVYINAMPDNVDQQTATIQIYPRGQEMLTGPITSLIIPVEQTLITGATKSSSRSGADILLTPEFSDHIDFSGTSVTTQILLMSFNISPYTYLVNKRILAVNFLYGSLISADPSAASAPPSFDIVTIPTGIGNFGFVLDTPLSASVPAKRMNLGPYNKFWQTPITGDFVPWAYTDLGRFDSSSANRMFAQITWGALATPISIAFFLFYAALEVVFCEERRLVVGISHPVQAAGGGSDSFHYGANLVTLRDMGARTTNPVLPAGDYTVTLSQAADADYNACRELYAIPGHPSYQMAIPALPEEHLGEQLVATETRILPQISLHTSGGPLTEVHVYGRQAIAQVFGTVTATQEILDSAALASRSWPHVRFYARRFGQTTVPLLFDSPTIAGSSVQITPAEFDALDEIIDGWKEISLRFTTPPAMGAGTNPQWRWSATGELPGNRWEILGATAPAISGIGGDLFNLVPSPNQLSSATYGAPASGATINLGWIPQYAPPVTATADDQTSDAVLLFAQDMATISGLAARTATQNLLGIGMECAVNPCCVPTALLYNRITWGLPANTGTALDTFTRTVAAGSWGSADSGQAYTTNGTAANFSVNGTSGLIVPTATASNREAWINIGGPDQDVQVELMISDAAETGQLWGGVLARLTDANNYYRATMRYTSTNTVELRLDKRAGGVETNLATVTLVNLSPSALTPRTIRLQVIGSGAMNQIRAKCWDTDTDEPWWQLNVTDGALVTGNNAGAFARDDTTVASTTFTFDNLVVGPPDFAFGYYELQRMDTVETDWATIMKATSVATTGFSDFEARVGIISSYRIRGVDVYGFEGPWSSTVTIYTATPGASGGCISQGHVLLFTSNERQDGSINLAYASAWLDQQVEENFTFPEARFVQLQAQYNRDFFVAFRPLERGGETFSRTVLVQAAAIAPETLADFRGLRDMAWDTVSYICVRDEDGNRWLATVLVPGGRVLRDRRLYLAPVEIIEVTATPSPVDP